MPPEPQRPSDVASLYEQSTKSARKSCANENCKCEPIEDNRYCAPYCAGNTATDPHCFCQHDRCMRECDLIMKGGITSGIVYPPLVLKLAKAYRFRNVGGTSAGAIAAAVTAAAEHGRYKRNRNGDAGFRKLERVREWLSDTANKNLRNLFQPSVKTQPLMNVLLYLANRQNGNAAETASQDPLTRFVRFIAAVRKVLRINDRQEYSLGSKRWLVRGVLIGSISALLLSALSTGLLLLLAKFRFGVSPGSETFVTLFLFFGVLFSVFVGLAGYLAGGLVYSARHLHHIATQEIEENFFGLCDGLSKDPSISTPPLTPWLNTIINDLAGIEVGGRPLTFGDLWETDDPAGDKKIDFRMVTSNLSQTQPYILPFTDNYFLFKQREIEELFPAEVVDHMIEYGYGEKGCYVAPEGFYFLPAARDFPVVVATRMSLSFPVLLSAIPLYTIKYNEGFIEAKGQGLEIQLNEDNLQLNWFSDGGICSNFPIHFFDAWLPSRPTFGVNLVSLPPEEFSREKDEVYPNNYTMSSRSHSLGEERDTRETDILNKAVYIPKVAEEPSPTWLKISGVLSFLGQIFNTAQNYRDNMQAMLPSYRERIVQIALTDKQGGLNLEMPSEVIEEVVDKGALAGEKLLRYFDFKQHQWVRFRVLMGQMEESLTQMFNVIEANELFRARELLTEQEDRAKKYPYRFDPTWGEDAWARLSAVGDIIRTWEPLFDLEPPLPKPKLRVTPEL
jgi:predicted acylesterase/phospholipase RssA